MVAGDGEELALGIEGDGRDITGGAAYLGGFMASTGTVFAEAGVSSVAPGRSSPRSVSLAPEGAGRGPWAFRLYHRGA